MEIGEFISKIELEFDELEAGILAPGTVFRELNDWDSMHALILIALIDVEYGVTLDGEDLAGVSTVQDLFDLVRERV